MQQRPWIIWNMIHLNTGKNNNAMRKVILTLPLLICSCCWENNLNDEYNKPNIRSVDYFWYYNKELFHGEDYCQLIGRIINEDNESSGQYINKRCSIYNDTIYVKRRYIKPEYNIFEGTIYINYNEHNVNIKLK